MSGIVDAFPVHVVVPTILERAPVVLAGHHVRSSSVCIERGRWDQGPRGASILSHRARLSGRASRGRRVQLDSRGQGPR